MAALDRQSGDKMHSAGRSRFNQRDTSGEAKGMFAMHGAGGHRFGDQGGASRFFYCAKVSTAERNAGNVTNIHATLKPVSLTTYLARLILPPPHISSRLLAPFCGTGSEIAGALLAGWNHVVGIDNDPDSVAIAHKRIPSLCEQSSYKKKKEVNPTKSKIQVSLFEEESQVIKINTEEDLQEQMQEQEDSTSTTPLSDSIPASSLPQETSFILSSLVLEYRRLGAEIDKREVTRKSLKEEIETIVLALPTKKVLGPSGADGWVLRRDSKKTKSINKAKLAEESTRRQINPVDVVEILAFATEEKRGKEFVVVTDGEKKVTIHAVDGGLFL